MVGTEQLLDMDKEDLIDIIKSLWTGDTMPFDYTPKAFSHESSYKDAMYSGYIDKDLEFQSIMPGLSNITSEDDVIYLNGDRVRFVPQFKSVNLYVKDFKVTGLVKTEIIAYMIAKWESIKVGEFQGWDKYFIEHKGHTLVANINGSAAGLKLLKFDHMAKKLYQKTYRSRNYTDWRELDEDEKIYGSKDISLPSSIDEMVEEVSEAVGVLERAMKYPVTIQAIKESGWTYNV